MKILIVAGGTGGHLYPGIALAKALSGHQITFVVRRGDIGKAIVEKEGFALREISGQGLPRAFSLRALAFPFNFLHGIWEARSLLCDMHPDRVVGMGGYLSIPVIFLAHFSGIRTLLHEQNAYPGLANRFLAHWADSVAVSFPASQPYFPKGKTWVAGLPIRPEIGTADQSAARCRLGLHERTPTILVFGGSLGAQKLNTVSAEAWLILRGRNLLFQVIHITGLKDFERTKSLYNRINFPAALMPYCHAMADVYAASDVVLSRAGASTIAELLAVRRPALLIPYPHASNNHQLYNAKVLEDEHLGKIVSDDALTPAAIADFMEQALNTSSRLSEGLSDSHRSDAAQKLAAQLL